MVLKITSIIGFILTHPAMQYVSYGKCSSSTLHSVERSTAGFHTWSIYFLIVYKWFASCANLFNFTLHADDDTFHTADPIINPSN